MVTFAQFLVSLKFNDNHILKSKRIANVNCDLLSLKLWKDNCGWIIYRCRLESYFRFDHAL